MGKFMIATFLVLGLAFWELSGGSDFVPEQRAATVAETTVEDQPTDVAVTRAVTQDIVTLTMPVASPTSNISAAETDAEVVLASVTAAIEEAPVAANPEPTAEVLAPAPVDLRYVSGNVVNMRGGPGTNFGVVDKLTRGTLTEVVQTSDNGWAQIIVPSTGLEGWMSERFLQR